LRGAAVRGAAVRGAAVRGAAVRAPCVVAGVKDVLATIAFLVVLRLLIRDFFWIVIFLFSFLSLPDFEFRYMPPCIASAAPNSKKLLTPCM
jgi:hypothetical protein